jgi:hypothetical protein
LLGYRIHLFFNLKKDFSKIKNFISASSSILDIIIIHSSISITQILAIDTKAAKIHKNRTYKKKKVNARSIDQSS